MDVMSNWPVWNRATDEVVEWHPSVKVRDSRLALTEVEHTGVLFRVLTIFLGYNATWLEPAQYFETNIFRVGVYQDIYLRRYTTAAQARKGHEAALIWLSRNQLAVIDGVEPPNAARKQKWK